MKVSHTAETSVSAALSFVLSLSLAFTGSAIAQQPYEPGRLVPLAQPRMSVAQLSQAQSTQSREDPQMAAARAAFESLPEATRRDIQDALIWTGDYKGGVDGGFGRMTHAAIQGWIARRGAARGGASVSSPLDVNALKAEAAKLRAQAAFGKVRDPRSGVVIGVPGKLFTRHAMTPGGQRHETADRFASIETFRVSDLDGGLKTLFEAYTAPVAGRRVTYRVLRPDFFVVVTQTATRASYSRAAIQIKAEDSGQNKSAAPLMRGFTMTWPVSQTSRYEKLSIAVANSFEPFPPAAAGAGRIAAQPKPPARLAPSAPVPQIIASAIAFSQDRFVAVLPGGVCPAARIGVRPAQILKHDPRTGLTLIDTDGSKARRLQLPKGDAAAGEAALVVHAEGNASAPQIVVTAGKIGASAPLRLQAAVPVNGDGGAVISRHGELIGMVAAAPQALRKLASASGAIAIPQASRTMVPASAVFDFLTSAGLEFLPAKAKKNEQSAGAIAAATAGSIFPLICTPQ